MTSYKNPVPTVDIIIQKDSNILMIRRKKDPFKDYLALPGGFVNHGETVEEAIKREALEEVSLQIEPIDILGVYSDPNRDPRGHILSVVFVGIILSGEARAGDDSASIKWLDLGNIQNEKLAFDHKNIISDYINWRTSGGTFWSSRQKIH